MFLAGLWTDPGLRFGRFVCTVPRSEHCLRTAIGSLIGIAHDHGRIGTGAELPRRASINVQLRLAGIDPDTNRAILSIHKLSCLRLPIRAGGLHGYSSCA